MEHPSPDAFLASAAAGSLSGGPLAVVLAEQRYMVRETVARMLRLGAAAVIVAGTETADLFREGLPEGARVIPVRADLDRPGGAAAVLNAVGARWPGRWIAWAFNGEFLFFPWCETRVLADITTFLAEERRRILYCYALDLYADPLPADGTAPEEAGLRMDVSGYHAFPKEQGWLDVYGGLGWRFEGMIPAAQQHIGRASLYRSDPEVPLGPELRFAKLAYASVSCPWHHNPTGAVMSLRRARQLFANPGFEAVRRKLVWAGSRPFDWSSAQLLELGMIEPGQWF